jgi:hypothetical protein
LVNPLSSSSDHSRGGPVDLDRARPGLDVHLARVDRLAAVGAAKLGLGQVPASAVAAENGRASLACRPAVAPGVDREQDVGELPPFCVSRYS